MTDTTTPGFFDRIINWIKQGLSIIMSVLAGFIAYRCHKRVATLPRIIMSLFAAYFGMYYLIYYMVIHVIFQIECPSGALV